MPIIVTRPLPPPDGSNLSAVLSWLVDAIGKLIELVTGLVTLDANVRETRSLNAERAVLFASSVVTNLAIIRMQALVPTSVTETYTTALIQFDAGSGPGRWRADGGDPLAAATAAAGMPIPTGGFTLTLTGALNIRSFAVIAEAANLNMSITLFK